MNEQTQDLQPTTRKKSLLIAMANKYSMDPEAFQKTIKATVMPANASNEQMAAFLMVANEHDLNPVTKEIYAFPAQGGGVTPVVGIDGWINLAQRRIEFDGIEFDFNADETGKPESCTCRVYRKDRTRPIVVTEYMAECRRDTPSWRSHPRRMLRHKAAIQAIRYAFGFSGIKDEDDADVIYANAAVFEHEPAHDAYASAAIMKAARQIEEPSTTVDENPERTTAGQEQETARQSGQFPVKGEDGIWRDSRGFAFDQRVHGMSREGIPAVSKADHFCKRRGCDPQLYAEVERAAQVALDSPGEDDGHQELPDSSDDQTPDSGSAPTDTASHAAGSEMHGSSGVTFGFPEINSAIARAVSSDACDEAQDMLTLFGGPADQREELEGMIESRRTRLAALAGGTA